MKKAFIACIHVIKHKPEWFIVLFFTIFFLVGISIFTDYGMSWDEAHSREVAVLNWEYAVHGDTDILFSPVHQNHGPAFSLTLLSLEKLFGLDSTQHVFYLYHLVTFLLFFAAVIVFYTLCRSRFNSTWLALLGVLFLVLSPRIFGESFYNPKDIPFLSLFIFNIFTLLYFLEKPSFSRVVAHAAVSAFAIDTRLQGLLIVALTFLFSVGDIAFVHDAWREWKNRLLHLSLYLLFCAGFIILFWPLLWENPVLYFSQAIQHTSRYVYEGQTLVLYLGTFIRADSVPWHYLPVWIFITTPLVYLVYFLFGVASIVKDFVLKTKTFYADHRLDLIFSAWLFLPLTTVILLDSVLYDGWRLLYFVYPALILIALVGINRMIYFFYGQTLVIRKFGLYGIAAMTILNLGFISHFMVKNHPYQHLYFNELIKNMEEARKKFDMDYWGLTFREGLEYIARTDASGEIPVAFLYNNQTIVRILPQDIMSRFKVVKNQGDAKYILNNYRFQDYELLPHSREIYAVTVGGAKVMSIFKNESRFLTTE